MQRLKLALFDTARAAARTAEQLAHLERGSQDGRSGDDYGPCAPRERQQISGQPYLPFIGYKESAEVGRTTAEVVRAVYESKVAGVSS